MAHTDISKQGAIILGCFETHKNKHLTADEISEILKKDGTPVSSATIYRQLDKLVGLGYIRKYISSPEEPACYQYHERDSGCRQHFHLKCISCTRLFHVSCEYIQTLEKHIEEHHGFAVDNTRTVLYGECENCRKAKVQK